MDEDSRRALHGLIVRASEKDRLAELAVEETIMGFDRSGAADDVEQALQMIAILGGDELHARIAARLQENDEARQRLQRPITPHG
jgi:hypothetical protein